VAEVRSAADIRRDPVPINKCAIGAAQVSASGGERMEYAGAFAQPRRHRWPAPGSIIISPTSDGGTIGHVGIVGYNGLVYSNSPGGVWVLTPDGKHLGTIRPPENPANLAWGDADAKTCISRRSPGCTGSASTCRASGRQNRARGERLKFPFWGGLQVPACRQAASPHPLCNRIQGGCSM
jgi:hypothetical protein